MATDPRRASTTMLTNPTRPDSPVDRMYRTTDMQAGCPLKPDCRRPADVLSTTTHHAPYKTR